MNPKISVIIPTFNRPVKLEKTLIGLINQTFENWECIIVDDNSKQIFFERLKEFTAKDKRITLIKKPFINIMGPSASRNLGLELAKGDYIQFFDDDDEMYPNMLQNKLKKIEANDLDVVVSYIDIVSVKENKIISQNKIFSNRVIEDYILGNISWYVSGPLWKKSFLREKFDEKIQTLDDWDFNIRNLYNYPKVDFIENSLQTYNRYGVEKTLSTKRVSEGVDQSTSVFLVYKKHYCKLLEKKMLTSELKNCLIGRIVFLLRQNLVRKNNTSVEVLKFLIGKNRELNKVKLLKILLGYYCFKFFNKGYRLLNY